MITVPASVVAVLVAPEVIHVLLGDGPKWDDVMVPFQIFAAGLIFRTSYKISDSLARAMGTVYRRAWRQAVYAVAVVGLARASGPVRAGLGGRRGHGRDLPQLPVDGAI